MLVDGSPVGRHCCCGHLQGKLQDFEWNIMIQDPILISVHCWLWVVGRDSHGGGGWEDCVGNDSNRVVEASRWFLRADSARKQHAALVLAGSSFLTPGFALLLD